MNKCCGSCCFPIKNTDLPNPKGQNWYDQSNLDRVWNESKGTGQFLMCHQTDPKAAQYGGKNSRKGMEDTHACVGLAFAVFMHIKIFEKLESYPKYVKAVGKKVAMSKIGLGEAVISFCMGKCSLFSTAMRLPTAIEDPINSLRLPSGFEKTVNKFNEFYLHQIQVTS